MKSKEFPVFVKLYKGRLRYRMVKTTKTKMNPILFSDTFKKSAIANGNSLNGEELESRFPIRKKPNGFIFHIGRCGSTLLTRFLNSDPKTIIISESSAITKFLLISRDFEIQTRRRAFVSLLSATQQEDYPAKYIFKFTSINCKDIEFILSCYPDVPWVYLYRNPQIVVESMLARPPAWIHLLIEGESLKGKRKQIFRLPVLLIEQLIEQFSLVEQQILKASCVLDYSQITAQDLKQVYRVFRVRRSLRFEKNELLFYSKSRKNSIYSIVKSKQKKTQVEFSKLQRHRIENFSRSLKALNSEIQ